MVGFMIQAMSSMMHTQMHSQGTPYQGTPPQNLCPLPPTPTTKVGQAVPVPAATNKDTKADSEEEEEEEIEENFPEEEE